ncbi:MAG TPA: tetratricopeptide repeat protein [Bryobacteraceae bacterium]|nr:tetratricopeptide repeat protein [Bryobacteraceae bacterium]
MTPEQILQQGLDHHREGRLPQAAECCQRILSADPQHVEALYLLAVIAHQSGQHEPAVGLLAQAISVSPDDVRCYNVLGLTLMELGRDEEAESCFQRGIAVSEIPELHNNLGTLWKKQGRLDEAIEAFRTALSQSPEYANAHYNLGNAWRERQQMEQAVASFRSAVAADPHHARALVALGQVLQAVGRPDEAVPILERAIGLIPGDAELYCDLGDALQTQRQWQPAIDHYRKAIGCNARSSRAWYAAGCAESSRNEHASAVFCFRKALESDPGRLEVQHNLGRSLFKLGQVGEAMDLFRQASADSAIAILIPGDPASSNSDILLARKQYGDRLRNSPISVENSHSEFGSYVACPQNRGVDCRNSPVRVGYVSAFFQDHNWMKPVWGLIHQHDRQRFEVHLFSDAPASAVRQGYRPHPSDQFHDISGLSCEGAADCISHAGIDVLIDLNGYSTPDRLSLFELRPARRILAWFNMYATSGMSCYDYLIGDAVVIPSGEEQFYTEKIARVPGSYLTFEISYPVPAVTEPPCLDGRPITFGCLASQYKITNEVIAAFSTILHHVPESLLLLKNSALGSPANRQFVESLFQTQGIPSTRLRLEGPSDHTAFLEAYSQVDIALDTFPYNGGTTTTEAIWQGVPVITFFGDRWVSRTSASILRAGGLGEFVASGLEDCIALAVRCATAPGARDRLCELRRNMRSRLLASSVCDTRTFARNMERLYAGG